MARRGELKRAFEQVRSGFFPRWDRKRLWRVRAAPFLVAEGRCEIPRKTIFIRKIPDSIDELKQLLIHEICHHNALGHEAKWFRNMEAAAQRAEAIGQEKMAKWIREEIESYEQEPKTYVSAIYCQLGDWIVDTGGKVPYKRFIVHLAHEFGLTVEQMEKRYKGLRRFYDDKLKAAKGNKN